MWKPFALGDRERSTTEVTGKLIMSDTIVNGIFGVVCVLLGVLFSGFGYFFRIRSDKNKVINNNLYYLIHLWHALAIIKYASFEKISSKYIDAFKTKTMDLEVPKNQEKAIVELCKNLLKNEVSSVIDYTIKNSKDIFNNSLPELSKIDPTLAYYISKISYFLSCREQIIEHVTIIRKKKEENTANKSLVEYFDNFESGLNLALDNIYSDLITLIESSLKKLAAKANFWVYFKVKYNISKRKKKIEEEIPIIEINKMVDKVVAMLEQKKQKENSGPILNS